MAYKKIQEKLCQFDNSLSRKVYNNAQKISNQSKKYYQILEYSCHGIPWLMIVTILSYTSSDNDFWLNLLIGLLFDIVYVAVCKALCRRRRPLYGPNDKREWFEVDKLSFPSGHASRAIYVALIFSDNISAIMSLLVWIWAIAVIISRVLFGRHFIGDVLGGCILGYFNYITQFTLLYPIHSLFKWFLLKVVLETVQDNY